MADDLVVDPQTALAVYAANPGYAKYARFVLAAFSAIPWVGSVLAAAVALHAENEQGRVNQWTIKWLEDLEASKKRLESTVASMIGRMEELGTQVDERLSDESYLGLVRHGFRVWDDATTDEKRGFVRKTLTNAAGTKLCSDDIIRMFLQWIEQYNELHFRVIRIVYKNPYSTRGDIWAELYEGEPVREDSAEADLFKLIVADLSFGHVIRQHRPTTADGRFLAAPRSSSRGRRSPTMKSAFDDDKPYVMTELGNQFVHYAMEELAQQLSPGEPA